MIRIFFFFLTIFYLSFVNNTFSQTTKTINHCPNEIIKGFQRNSYPEDKSMTRLERHCLSLELVKHFKRGWRGPIMSPTPEEIEWYNYEVGAFQNNEMTSDRYKKFTNSNIFLKIQFVDKIDKIIVQLKDLSIITVIKNYSEVDEKNKWGNFFYTVTQDNLFELRQELISKKIFIPKKSAKNTLNCNVQPSCWNHLILPNILKAIL